MTEKNAEAAVADLAERLEVLAAVLAEDFRFDDAALVREAIAALPKATVVGTPWTTPLKGDKCVRTDGKSREAVKMRYRRYWMAPPGQPMQVDDAAEGYHLILVTYRDQKGREDTISASSWATWCRAACRAGGSYVRGETP